MGYASLVLLGLFVASAVAVPLDYSSEQCARHCTESHDFRYKPGTTYTYNYETTTVTTLQGTTADKSQVHLTAEVDIEVLSKCELSLRLRNVALKQSDPTNTNYVNLIKGSREFTKAVEKNSLRFSYQDGQVETLCPTDGEPVWVLNIKRGVLSSFQTSMAKLDGMTRVVETDVSGKCVAEYHSMGRGWKGTLTLRKTKDLTTCTDRHNSQTSLQSTPYAQNVPVQSLPLIKGTQECEQSIGYDILQSATCTEIHMFRPFSNHNNGAITTVTQKLAYVSMTSKTYTGNDYRPTREDMLFDHEYEDRTPIQRTTEAEKVLSELCQAAKDSIQASVPNRFANFVYKLRQLDNTALNNIYRRVDRICPDNPSGRKFFMDAIPVVGTSASVRLMYDLIAQRVVTDADVDFWFTSLAFVSTPTREMITILTPLLDGRNEQAILGVSALIHTFCLNNGECSSSTEVKDAVKKLVSNLGETCYGPEERKVLLTLKAIGNIGQIDGQEAILERCFRNPQNSIEVRLAAIQAFRRLSCDLPRENLMTMFADYRENAELRIAAYLASMICPSPQVIRTVRETLEKEKVNQVGSFIWTHLNNIQKSSNPVKQQVKDIVFNLNFMNKFHTDIRKFSRAMEGSFFFDSINTGMHVDSHLIFSPESFMIRSAMLNFTFDLFGHTCNLFEVGGRVEGLDRAMESFFGPKGYFPQESISKVWKNMREKRSIADNKVDVMDRQFDAKSRFNKDPSGSFYLKVMGNVVLYSPFGGPGNTGNSLSLNDLITELARQQEVEFTKSFMFLDTTYTIPMATGMPLRLALNGTATFGLKMGGKFEVRSFKEVDIRGRFQPSGAVEIASLLTVDAGEARTGMRIVATMHTSSLVDGQVEVRNGEVVRVQLNVPRDRLEIVDMQSKIFLVHGSDEKEQEGVQVEQTKVKSCTGDYVRKILGIELCADLQTPGGSSDSPLFPLSGPAVFKFYLQKTDPSLTSYNFETRWDKQTVNNGYIRRAVISLNTPNSRIDRELSAEFNLNQPERSLAFRLRTPFKRVGANAKYIDHQSQKRFDLSVTVDDKESFAVHSELQIQKKEGGATYTPTLEVRAPSGTLLAVKGATYLRHGQKYNGQLTIEGPVETPITLKGGVEIKDKDRYEVQLGVGSYGLDANVQSYLQLGDSVSSKLTVDYRLLQGRRDTVDVSGKFRDLSANALTKYTGVLNLQASALPQYATTLSWEMQSTTGQLENTLQINVGDTRRSRVHKINLQEIVRYEGTLEKNKVAVTLKMVYPERNIDYMLDMKHENTPEFLKNRVNIQYAPGKQVNTLVDVGVYNPRLMKVKGDLRLEYPGRDMRLMAEVNEERKREYQGTLTAQWQRGRQVKAVVNYKNRSDRYQMRHETQAEVILPRRKPITMATVLGISSGQYVTSAEVDLGRGKYRFSSEYSNPSSGKHSISSQLALLDNVYSTEASLVRSAARTTGNVDIKMSTDRHITSKLEIANSDTADRGTFELAWDADRDQSRRIVIDTELRCPSSGYEGKATITVPDRTIRGSFVTTLPTTMANNRVELEWAPDRKVTVTLNTNSFHEYGRSLTSGELLVLTTFRGYENMGLMAKYVTRGRNEWDTQLNLHWSTTQKIVILSEGSYQAGRQGRSLLANAKVTTPFRDFESMSASVVHVTGPSELSSKWEAQWGYDKKVGLGVYGSLTGSGFRGGMNFTSPLASFEQITTTVSHTYSPGSYRTLAELQWSVSKKITLDFDGRGALSGRRRTCSVTLKGTTPFRGFETTSAKILYNSDGVTTNVDSEMNWNYNKMTYGMSGYLRPDSNGYLLEGKTYFTSPFRNYNNLQLTTSLKTAASTIEVSLDAQLPRNKMANFKLQGRMPSLSDVEANAEFTSSYLDFERMSLNIAHKYDKNLRTSLEASSGEKKMTALLSGMFSTSYRSHDLEGALVVKTPFRAFEQLKISLTHNRRDLQFITKLQGNLNQHNIMAIHDHKIKDSMNYETNLQVSTPFRAIPTLKITSKQEYSRGQFRHNSAVEMERNKKTVLSVECMDRSTNAGSNLRAVVKLSTPSYNLQSLNVDASYENIRSRYQYKPRLSIEWNVDKRISIEGLLVSHNFRSVDSVLTFTSPFYGYEFLNYVGKYDLTLPKNTAFFSFQWRPRSVVYNSMVTFRGSMNNEPDKGELELLVTSPFSGYEKMSLTGNYDVQEREMSASLSSQWSNKKMEVSGQVEMSDHGAALQISVIPPIENANRITAGAKYKMEIHDVTGEINLQWAPEKKVMVVGEFLKTDSKTMVKLATKTPFPGYEIVVMELKGDVKDPKKTLNGFFQWNVFKKVELTTELTKGPADEGALNMIFRSPFRGYEEINVDGRLKRGYNNFQTEVTFKWHPEKRVTLNGDVTHNGVYPTDVLLNLDAPFTAYKNIKYTYNVGKEGGRFEIRSEVEWDRRKKMDMAVFFEKRGMEYVEGKFVVNTPFRNYRTFSIESNFRNQGRVLDGEVNLVTPFKGIETLSFKGTLRTADEGYFCSLSAETPGQLSSISGVVKNQNFRPFETTVIIEAPFATFERLTVNCLLNTDPKNVLDGKLSISTARHSHSIGYSLMAGNEETRFELKTESPLLPVESFALLCEANYADQRNMQGMVSVEYPKTVHRLMGALKNGRREMEAKLKMESPLLREEVLTTTVTYTSRRKALEGSVIVASRSQSHEVSAKYDTDNRQTGVSITIESPLLTCRTLTMDGKYINSNNRDMEVPVAVNTPNSAHTLVGTLRNYGKEKEVQLKMDCPLMSFRTLSVTGTFKNDNFEAMEGAVTASMSQKEVRIAGNMKRNGWNNFEAFVTMNTPYDPFRMVRIDTKLSNDGRWNMDGMVQVETSHERFRKMGITGKVQQSSGTEDVSITLRLPMRDYHTVGILGTLHHNPDFTSVNPRLTVSIPSARYSVYGNYEATPRSGERTATVGYEWGRSSKVEVTANAKNVGEGIDWRVMVVTPFRHHENYETRLVYDREGNSRNALFTYRTSEKKEISVRGMLTYSSPDAFEAELGMATPFRGYEEWSSRVRRVHTGAKHITNAEWVWSPYDKISVTYEAKNNRSHATRFFQLETPFELLQVSRLTFTSYSDRHNNELYGEAMFNSVDMLRGQVVANYDRSVGQFKRTVTLDLPSIPFTISTSSKPLPAGSEVTIKTITASKTVNFQTTFQNTGSVFLHEASLACQEKVFSYEIRASDTSRGRNIAAEFSGKLAFPNRAFELRGTRTSSHKSATCELDFYWDASRDKQKHMVVGFEHQDISTRGQTAHKLKLIASHPRLSKDIVATSQWSTSPAETYGKVEVEYSRFQQHNIIAETRVRNMARNRRGTHYNLFMTARHPASNLDMRFTGEVINTEQEASAHAKFNHLDSRNQQKLVELKTKILKLRKEIDLLMRSDSNQMTMKGQMFHQDREFTLALEGKINDQQPMHSHLRYSSRHKKADLNVTTPDYNSLHMTAFLQDYSTRGKISHSTYGRTYSDATLYLGLDPGKIVKMVVNWRPDLWNDVKGAMSSKYNEVSRGLSSAMTETYHDFSTEASYKLSQMAQAMGQEMQAFKDEISEDMARIQSDIQRGKNELYRMYRENEFYMQDISRGAINAWRSLCYATLTFLNNMARMTQGLCHFVLVMMETLVTAVANCVCYCANLLARGLMYLAAEVFYAMQWTLQMVATSLMYIAEGTWNLLCLATQKCYELMSRYAPFVENFFIGLRDGMYNMADSAIQALFDNPFAVAIRNYWNRIVETFNAFRTQSFINTVQRQVVMTYNTLADVLGNSASSAAEYYDTIINHPTVDYISDLGNRAMEKGLKVYSSLDTVSAALLENTVEQAKTLVRETLLGTIYNMYHMQYAPDFRYAPGSLTMEYSYALPSAIIMELLEVPQNSPTKASPLSRFSVWDVYYRYKRIMNPSYWIPPFKTHAVLAGNQHYITFDKFHFDFAGECSYLLARDFVDGNFTVSVNYASDGERIVKKSLTVLTEGKKIEVSPDYKVTIDDTKVELPQQIGGTTLKREGSVVRLHSDLGFDILFNFVHDVCTVKMSGFYFGKTAGLFGTYDNEPFLDMMTPDRRMADSIDTFANSWEVGTAVCRKGNNLATVAANDFRVKERCDTQMLSPQSEFRMCFKQVDPEPYQRMCVRDLSLVHESMFDTAICTSAAAYVQECKEVGVPLRMPKSCVRCEKHDGSMMEEGDIIKLTKEDPVQSADVVFLVEEKECNRDVRRMLGKLAQGIEDTLRLRNYRNIQYAVVGFGGDNVHSDPHIHTIDGLEFGSVRAVESAFASLTVGDGPMNIFSALRYAASLPFRAGVTKSFVLAKCSPCKAQDCKSEYGDMLRTLLDGDISLHLLMNQEFETKTNKRIRVIGMDSKYAYTLKDVKRSVLKGDRDLLAQLKVPKDVCIPLALEVNGSSFLSQALTETRKNTYKKLIDVMARRISMTAEPSECQVCECIAANDGVGKSVCQRCLSPDIANLLSPDLFPIYNSKRSSDSSSEDVSKENDDV